MEYPPTSKTADGGLTFTWYDGGRMPDFRALGLPADFAGGVPVSAPLAATVSQEGPPSLRKEKESPSGSDALPAMLASYDADDDLVHEVARGEDGQKHSDERTRERCGDKAEIDVDGE